MMIALKSHTAAYGSLLCLAMGHAGCAQGVAGKQPFEDTIDNGTSVDSGAANGADSSGDNSVDPANTGGASAGDTGGASTSSNGGGTATTGGASTGSAGDAGPVPLDAGMKDAGTSCLPGATPCGAACVDLKSSAANCGQCGRACPGGQACNGAGACLAPAGCSLLTFETHDYFACTATKSWVDARTACLGWGMDLPIVESANENNFLKARPGWLAYNDLTTEGSWLWAKAGGVVNGPAATYTNWDAPGEPNNDRNCDFFGCDDQGGEDCAELKSDGTWNDGLCRTTRAFLCETY